ncbi:hypothetical protein ACES2L_01970 [Bdellovibrio bacteriovorus]
MLLSLLTTISCALLPSVYAYPSRAGYDPFARAATHEYNDSFRMKEQIKAFVAEVQRVKLKPAHQKNLKQYLYQATTLLAEAQKAKSPEQVSGVWVTAISLRQEFRKYVRNYALL